MLSGMFSVSEAEAAAIRAAYERGGELELRQHCPGIDARASFHIASARFFEIKTRRLGGLHIKPRVKSE